MEEQFSGFLSFWRDGHHHAYPIERSGTSTLVSNVVFFGLDLAVADEKMTLSLHLEFVHDVLLDELYLDMPITIGPQDQLFLNGYQSWTESKLFAPDAHIKPLRGPFPQLVNTTGDYTFYKGSHRPGHLHAWSMTSLVRNDGTFFCLDTSPDTGYTVFEWDCAANRLRIRKEVGGQRMTANEKVQMLQISLWLQAGTEVSTPQFPGYQARPVKAPVSGWTSWYNYYTKIDEQIILDNLRAFSFRNVPIDFFQIDDGWQLAVGDWTTANAKFPLGMGHIADQVHRFGYRAGLWLAPLIVEQKSTIYQQHRDWLLTHDGERLVEAGFNPGWGGLAHGTYYVLNLDLPAVQAHLRGVFDTVLNVWGYDLVKLDFLFAAGLVPAGGRSRGQRMAAALALLRACCGDKLILGCGVPLAAAWGRADYCRIGPDIGLSWELGIAKTIHLRERISTHTALHNTINRRHLSGRMFANDPDVFILRKENNELSRLQQLSLLYINHIFGDLLFTSDDITTYDAATMRLYRSTFPLLPRRVKRVDNAGERYGIFWDVGNRSYFAAVNLSREDIKVALPDVSLYQVDAGTIEPNGVAYLRPYETRIYLIHSPQTPSVMASDLHIFPGCEIDVLRLEGNGIVLSLHPQVSISGSLVLRVGDQASATVSVNGQDYPVEMRAGVKCVALSVQDGKIQ